MIKDTFQFLRFTSKGFRSQIGLIVFIELFEVGFSLAFVWYSKIIIDIATGVRSGELLYYSILLVVLMTLQILFRLIDIHLRRMTEVRMANSIRYNVFSHLLYTRWQELSSIHSGDMITRIIKDTDDVISLMVTTLPMIIAATAQFVGALVILYILDPMLALILGVGMPLLAFLSKIYYTYMRKYTLEVKESELERLDKLQSKLHKSVEKKTKVSIFANLLLRLTFNGG